MIKLTPEQYKAFLLFKGMTKEEQKQFIKQHEEAETIRLTAAELGKNADKIATRIEER